MPFSVQAHGTGRINLRNSSFNKGNITSIVNAKNRAGGGGRLSFNNFQGYNYSNEEDNLTTREKLTDQTINLTTREKLTDQTIKEAVNSWINESTRAATVLRYGPIENWDTSLVTDMSGLFDLDFPPPFNEDISSWNMQNVKYGISTVLSQLSERAVLGRNFYYSSLINWYIKSNEEDLIINNFDMTKYDELLIKWDNNGDYTFLDGFEVIVVDGDSNQPFPTLVPFSLSPFLARTSLENKGINFIDAGLWTGP